MKTDLEGLIDQRTNPSLADKKMPLRERNIQKTDTQFNLSLKSKTPKIVPKKVNYSKMLKENVETFTVTGKSTPKKTKIVTPKGSSILTPTSNNKSITRVKTPLKFKEPQETEEEKAIREQ